MENEIPSVNRVDDIRERLADLKGKRLKVKANMGRSRTVELFDADSGEKLFDYAPAEEE